MRKIMQVRKIYEKYIAMTVGSIKLYMQQVH